MTRRLIVCFCAAVATVLTVTACGSEASSGPPDPSQQASSSPSSTSTTTTTTASEPSTSSTDPAPASLDNSAVYKLVVTAPGLIAGSSTEWYQPATGAWSTSARYSSTGQIREVYDGKAFAQSDGRFLDLSRGPEAFVRAVAQPGLFDAPGVLFYWEYLRHVRSNSEVRIREAHANGHLVLTVRYAYPLDSGTKYLHYQIVVEGSISGAQAASQGVFRLPSGAPSHTFDAYPPGAPSHVGVNAYWFGPTFQGRTARTVLERQTSAAELAAQHSDEDAKSYEVVYRLRNLPTVHRDEQFFGPYPGLGSQADGDLLVKCLPPETPENPSEPPGDVSHITLADGEHATVTSYTTYATGFIYVRTDRALITLSSPLFRDMPAGRIATLLAATLRPVQ